MIEFLFVGGGVIIVLLYKYFADRIQYVRRLTYDISDDISNNISDNNISDNNNSNINNNNINQMVPPKYEDIINNVPELPTYDPELPNYDNI